MFVSYFPIFVHCLGFLSKVIQHDSLSAIACGMKFVGLLERPPCLLVNLIEYRKMCCPRADFCDLLDINWKSGTTIDLC